MAACETATCGSLAKTCDGQQNAARLKGLLLEQAIEHERLNQELREREGERWQLLQLLHQKDEQLSWQEAAVSRQCSVLAAARDSARHFLALSTLRAWQDHVQRRRAQRLLSRTKGRCAAASLRYACGQLSVGLRSAVARQLGKGVRAMWLHSALHSVEMSGASDDKVDQSAASSLASMLEGAARTPTKSRQALEALLATPPSHSGHFEDDVLFATPVRGLQSSYSRMSPRPKDPQHRYFSSPSEVSTCVPSSSSHTAGTSVPSNPFAGARLSLAIEALSRRRLFWAISKWHDYDADMQGSRGLGMLKADTFPSERHLSKLEGPEEQNGRDNVRLAALKAECNALESQVASLTWAEETQQAQLRVAQQQEEVCEQGNADLEEELSRLRSSQELASTHELQAVCQLRERLVALQESHVHAEQHTEEAQRRCSASEELVVSSEESCARLEAKLARKVRWRQEAEHHIREMVACGENLEQERAQMRQQLSKSRLQGRAASKHAESLRQTLEQQEQLGETLKARSCTLHEDNAALTRSLQKERQGRMEDMAHRRVELNLLRQEEAKASSALTAVDRGNRSELQAAEFARAKLMAIWSKERDEWSNHSYRITAELQKQLSSLQLELQTSRHAEKAELESVKEARAGTASSQLVDLQAGMGAMREAVRMEFAGETELCRQMASQLEHRLAQAQELQDGLEEFAATLPDPTISRSPLCSSGFATPQLRELDAYAELVDRLRLEVSREREERQASAQSLETLRSSYRLLLHRVSAAGTTMVSTPTNVSGVVS